MAQFKTQKFTFFAPRTVIFGENCIRIHCSLEAFKKKYGCEVHYFMNEEEAIREMHEEAIVPAGYTTIESIAEFLEQQGCVYSVSYDRE